MKEGARGGGGGRSRARWFQGAVWQPFCDHRPRRTRPVMMAYDATAIPIERSGSLGDEGAGLRWSVGLLLATLAFSPLLVNLLAGPDANGLKAVLVLVETAIVGAWAWRRRDIFVPRRPGIATAVLLTCWITAAVVATVVAIHPAAAVLRSAEWLACGLIGLMLWSEFQRDPSLRVTAIRAVPVGMVAMIGYSLLFAASLPDPLNYDWAHDMPLVGHVRHLGIYAFCGASFAAYALVDPGASAVARRLSWVALALGWGAVIWSGGRASAGALLVVGLVLSALASGRRFAFVTAFLAALAAGVALSLAMAVPHPALGLWRILGASVGLDEVGFSNGRAEMWQSSLAAWRERPWLGHGPNGTTYVLARYGQVQPHNIGIQALVEWGVLGAVPAIGLLVSLVLRALSGAWRAAGEQASVRATRVIAAAFLTGATANALLDGIYYDTRTMLLVTLAAAIALVPVSGAEPPRLLHGSRLLLRAGTLAVATVMLTHAAAVSAVWSPDVPGPSSARVALLRAFPSPSRTRQVASWATAWSASDPDAALAWARWGARNAHMPLPFIQLEADLLLRAGRDNEARERLTAIRLLLRDGQ